MSHVVSSQPSATSPYQPTAMTETGQEKAEPTRIHGSLSDSGQDDCCISTRNRTGLGFVFCKLLSLCCQGIKNCTESCCDSCANCLNDCCEDKPRDRARNYNTRYSTQRNYYDNNTCFSDDATWGVSSLSDQHVNVGVGSADISRNDDLPTHTSHHTSGHDSSTHHTSGHDSTHHTSHDTGGGGHDSGHSGGGDTGGHCESGGGDSGGGCDDGGGGDCGGGCDD